MEVTINGKITQLNHPQNLQNLITGLCPYPQHVVAEVNGKILKSVVWSKTPIQNGDLIELISFVGGG